MIGFIVAPTLNIADNYVHDNGLDPKDYRFLTRPERLLGYNRKGAILIYVDGYRYRGDLHIIQEICVHHRIIQVYIDEPPVVQFRSKYKGTFKNW